MNELAPAALDNKVPWGIFFALGILIVPIILAPVMVHYAALALGYDFDNLTNIQNLYVTLTTLATQLVLVLLALNTYGKKALSALKLRRPNFKTIGIILGFFGLYFLLAAFVIVPLTDLLLSPELVDQAQDIGIETSGLSVQEYALTGLAIVVLVPIVEEVMFRGILFSALRKKMPFWFAVIISSILFGVAHLQLNVAIDTFFLGILLCLIYAKTNNLWAAVGLHSLKNATALVLLATTGG